jgi:PQQ enzyme repeat
LSNIKKYCAFATEIFGPLVTTWSVALYLHVLHLFRIFEVIESQIILHLLFIPVILVEFRWRMVNKSGEEATWRNRIVRNLPPVGRILFWFGLFVFWVIIVGAMGATETPWQKWLSLQPYLVAYLIGRLGGYLTVIAAALWIGLYYLVVVKYKSFRVTLSLMVPCLLALGIFYHFNIYGGTASFIGVEDIVLQPGVELVLDHRRISADATAWPDPRDVYASDDSKIVYASFGASFRKIDTEYAAVVRYDIAHDRLDYFNSYNIRKMAFAGQRLFVAPALWHRDSIFELSTEDLLPVREIPAQIENALDWWEPMDIFVDEEAGKLFLSDNLTPVLLVYDLNTGRRGKILDLQGRGIIGVGGNVFGIHQSETDRTLYMAGGPGQNLLAVNPDTLQLIRQARFDFCVMGSALEFDQATGRLYMQCGAVDDLYEIDAKNFEVLRIYRGEFHSRGLTIDSERNCIYVLGFGSGTLFALDLKTGLKRWSLNVGSKPNSMYLDPGRNIWINSKVGILRIDLQKVWDELG